MSSKMQVSPTGAYVNPQLDDIYEGIVTEGANEESSRRLSFFGRLLNSLDRRASTISTSEVIPKVEFYRDYGTASRKLKRPDIEQLHSQYTSSTEVCYQCFPTLQL